MTKKFPNNSVKDFYDCTEEIAQVFDKYFGRQYGPVQDMEHINKLVEEYVGGWGIDARTYGVEDREVQQKRAELEEESSTDPAG